MSKYLYTSILCLMLASFIAGTQIILPSPQLLQLGQISLSNIDDILLNTMPQHDYMRSIPPDDIVISYEGDDLILRFKNHKYIAFSVDGKSNSMKGVYGGGNILIAQLHPENISLYDHVVGIEKEEDIGISHQVVKINKNCIITKGTGNYAPDSICWKKKDIIFKYAGVIWTG